MDNDKIRVCDGQGNYVFVSYAHKDTERVIPVIRKLTEAGCRIWYDGGIGVGSEWAKEVSSYIEDCTVFISFMSQNYLNSDNCIDEIYHAKSKKKNISLIYLEDASLPGDLQMRVGRYHYERIYKYKKEEDFYNNLLKAEGIRKCISKEETLGDNNLPTKESLEDTVSWNDVIEIDVATYMDYVERISEEEQDESIISLTEDKARSNSWIFPNDPCPCGSGLKYKNCCGRK